MISIETWLAYTLACVLIILSPGPDNILAISRGLSQGRVAGVITAVGAGLGLMVHVLAAVFGLALLIQTSAIAFDVIKYIGAAYLIYLGIKAIKTRDLISFLPKAHAPLKSVFMTGLLTNVLNPKPAIFVLAFVPQFVTPNSGTVFSQTLQLGVWFAVLAAIIFTCLGCSASVLARYLRDRPRTILGLNIGAGITFICAGISVAVLNKN
jgi:threonine/homoserine/homoserine lactone efflux protein